MDEQLQNTIDDAKARGLATRALSAARASAQLRCSFCCKTQREVAKLVAGAHALICDECIGQCVEILRGSGSPLG